MNAGEPAILKSGRISLAPGRTTRTQIERELGVGFSYPARGWHTHATNEGGKRCLLSCFFKDAVLVAAELYVPRVERAPALQPHELGGFTLEPGGLAMGTSADAVDDPFTEVPSALPGVIYDRTFEARFAGGIAYAMARGGRIERLAIYAGAPPA